MRPSVVTDGLFKNNNFELKKDPKVTDKGCSNIWYFWLVSCLQRSLWNGKQFANMFNQNHLDHVHYLEWNKVYCNQRALVTFLATKKGAKLGFAPTPPKRLVNQKFVRNGLIASVTGDSKKLIWIFIFELNF